MIDMTTPEPQPNDEAARRFVEDFALVFTNAGLQRMPARVFSAVLATQKGSLTATEIAEALQVSPAAVSGAVRYLIHVGLMSKAREPGERVDHYRILDDAWYESVGRKDETYRQLAESIERGIAALGPESPAGKRLQETHDFFLYIAKELPLLIERWRSDRKNA
jgi:DNA-binding transcriptional regulator GbsR (MarR family)